MQPHSYEEIRDAAIDILLGRDRVEWKPEQYSNLVTGVAEVLERRSRPEGTRSPYGSAEQIPLAPQDQEFVRDVFWDLFRQGIITLGLNRHNDAWPWFRLSHFGQQALATQGPYRFHDTSSFINLVKGEAPDISPEALAYLDEAVAAFYAGCLWHAWRGCRDRIPASGRGRRAECETRHILRSRCATANHTTEDPEISRLP